MKGKNQKIRNLISNISVKEKYKIKNHQKEKQSCKVESGAFRVIESQTIEIKI